MNNSVAVWGCSSTPEEFGFLGSLNFRQFLLDNLCAVLEEFGVLVRIDFVDNSDAASVGIVHHFLTNVLNVKLLPVLILGLDHGNFVDVFSGDVARRLSVPVHRPPGDACSL